MVSMNKELDDKTLAIEEKDNQITKSETLICQLNEDKEK